MENTADPRTAQLEVLNEVARIATLDLELRPMLQRITDTQATNSHPKVRASALVMRCSMGRSARSLVAMRAISLRISRCSAVRIIGVGAVAGRLPAVGRAAAITDRCTR